MDSGLTTVRCPSANCIAELAFEDVCAAAAADRALVERYDSLLLRQALGSDTSFVWCKNTSCGSGQFHPDGVAAPIITCRRCGSKSCFQHDVVWHDGFTCSEYDAHRRPVNIDTADYLRRYTKVCPHCSRMVEKIDGCDHMVCVRPGGCGSEFCWVCLADWTPIRTYGNSRHNVGCRHYRTDDQPAVNNYDYDSD
ncbi:E3 ubiquitin-protein ligase arih1l OS=Danio rerio GN=arih1l PE=2 SV=1 [Rhizoctonia solani AG-1 IB]|uniref:RBR-type E3 ubiquitin transferase n=1 Tax=Thanatephorus cucumeris (strain AG1-IB / isolate 7/3/14) TaxID=1108050 RepID=A0A0B7FSY6_THACB|nr:E3 ubiquitin-protein ligase arih1l OS=Danio rerio GN=arih1l PE=2 SV=1 [Rhizoctonia solani AG-1 IB]